MTETARFKNVVKLFLLVIAVGLTATALPATFAERIDNVHEVYSETVYELKEDLTERVGRVWALNESAFTADSWSNLHITATSVESALADIAQRFADLEVYHLEMTALQEEREALADLEETAETFEHELPNLEETYQGILMELQELETALDAAYQALVSVDVDVIDDSAEELDGASDEPDESDDAEEDTESEVEGLDLLSITRQEFERMTTDEIVEMAEEGEYIPVEVIPNDTSLLHTCPNIDGVNFVNNVIVDGEVCIGNSFEEANASIEPFSSVDISNADAFLLAWNNSYTTVITLMNDIVLTTTATAMPRTTSIRIEGNGHHLVMTSRGTTAANTVNAGLTLGATTAGSTLEFNNVLIGRVITNAGGNGASAASLTGAVAGAAQPVALFTSTDMNSSNWNVYFHDDVRSSTTSPAAIANNAGFIFNNVFGTGNAAAATANPQSRSGILNMPNSVVHVTGTGNSFATHSTHSTGVTVFNVREFNVVNLPPIEITGAGGGVPFAPHTRINISNLAGLGCHIVPAGITEVPTDPINAPCLIVEENATLNFASAAFAATHAIEVTYDVIVRDGGTITINDRTGTGHGINARRVDFGANTNFNFSRTGNATVSGHGISASEVAFGNHANVDISLTVTGTAAANVTGTGIHAPLGSVTFGNDAVVNITRDTGTQAANNTQSAIDTNDLVIGSNAHVDINVSGRGHGLWVQNLELKAGSQPVNHDSSVLPWEQNITTTTLNVISTGATDTSVRVRGQGEINIRENARVRISTGTSTAVETSAGNHAASNGLFGYISVFNMEGNSFMDINATGVAFRSRLSTTYTMTDGARKNVYARIGTGDAGVGNNAAGRSAFILANTYITGTTGIAGAIANRTNHTHSITLSGEGTILNVEGYPGNLHNTGATPPADGRPNRSNMMIYGDNSTVNISDGATLKNVSHRTTALTVFGQGTQFNVNTGGFMDITVHGSGNADSGAFRFLQAGSQTFNLNGGEVHITATAGNAGLLRAFGGNNAFYVTNRGRFVLSHLNESAIATAAAIAGNVPRGMDFASGSSNEATADRFVVSGYRSEVYINIANGIGVDGDSGSSVTRVEVNDGAIMEISAESRMPSGSPSAANLTTITNHGVFNAGVLILRLNNPMFFDFVQRGEDGRMGEALLFNTGAASRIEGTNTDLAVWRNARVGNVALIDPISSPARGFWTQMDFTVAPNTANFASTAIASTNEPNFSVWFTTTNLPTTGANAGWRQIRRLNANNANPTVDILRTPTDADQRIFGHVSIAEGSRSARSAGENEVFVDLIINNADGDFVQRINNVPTGYRPVFNEAAHYGVFEAVIDFSVGFETGTTFLPVGYTVEVVRARRSSVLNPNTSVTTTDPNNGVPLVATTYRYRETSLTNYSHLILVETETVRDVTPPLQVGNVTALVNGVERFDGAVTPASTTITGTGDPGAIVRVGRVTPATGAVTSVEWFDGTATVGSNGDWEFTIPAGITLAVGNRLSIYTSDGETLDGDSDLRDLIPEPVAPNVIYRPELATPETLERLSNRWRIANITLPRTARTDLWPAAFGNVGEIGNINYHYNQPTAFHDATGANAFDHAYILTVEEVLDSDFEFTKVREITETPLPGAQFRLYRRAENGVDWEPITTLTSGANGVVTFTGLLHGGEYRLREHAPAPGFAAPPANHYWLITVDNNGVVTHASGTTDTPPINEVDGDLILINEHLHRPGDNDFEFIKVSSLTEQPLPGAAFNLYRRAENGEDWELIFDDLVSGADGIVSLSNLRYGGEYRLIETNTPANYDEPPVGHYWIINVDINDGSIMLPTHHGDAPPFSEGEDGAFLLANTRSRVTLFGFVKTENDGETPLPGAAFDLYRWHVVDNDWEFVDDFVSGVGGVVSFENLLTYGSQYRLIETDAPDGFVTPPTGHHWLITVDSDGNIETPTHHGGAPAFDDEDGLSVPNDAAGVEFRFTKTNEYLYRYDDLDDINLSNTNFARLPGATFTLRRWDEAEGDWSDVIETVISSSDPETLGLVAFETLITLDGRYRLDETQAPNGFRAPHGHWEITWNATTERFDIEAHGTVSLVPAFRTIVRDEEVFLYVGNFREIPLPGTGGLGVMSLTIIGALSLMLVTLLYIRGKVVDDIERLKGQVG